MTTAALRERVPVTKTRAVSSRGNGTGRTLHVPKAMGEAYHYDRPVRFSRGMQFEVGQVRFVMVSGTASVGSNGETLHPGDFSLQAQRAYENARAVLNRGGADWPNVVKTTIFLKDIAASYEMFNRARDDYFRKIGLSVFPASTCVEARLCRDDLLIEMELFAVVNLDA